MKTPEHWLHVERFPNPDGAYANEDFTAWVEAIQQDAYLAGLEKAGEIVTDYAKLLRGAHVNTNNSCGSINKAILAEMDRVRAK